METQQRKDWEDDGLTITGQRNTRTKTSENGNENLELLPIDLIIEILCRLPAKSIARCRCVSKLWTSILGRQDFTELFLTRSCARPRLLFVCGKGNGELFFFTTPQLDSGVRKSGRLIASYHMSFPFYNRQTYYYHPSPVNGLICLRIYEEGKKEVVPLICNPSTGQSLPLPKVKTRKVGMNCYLGYDPIDKQYKVLSMTYDVRDELKIFEEHQVLTLGTQKPSWRMVECCIPFFSVYDEGLCVNGFLYYKAAGNGSLKISMIVCFDVRSEKFGFVKVVETGVLGALHNGVMVNYNGKLGLLMSNGFDYVNNRSTSIELWILQDFEKQEWSKHVLLLPASWKPIVRGTGGGLQFAGVTQTNEIVLSPFFYDFKMPYYVFYCNIERNTFTRLQLEGMGAYEGHGVDAYVNHVEDLKPM